MLAVLDFDRMRAAPGTIAAIRTLRHRPFEPHVAHGPEQVGTDLALLEGGDERVSTWADPAEHARAVARSYRRDFWDQQPHRVQVWSEKGTVRGVLRPVLDHYAVGFLPVHGFSSATEVHNAAEDYDGRPLIVLYVGDYDPSGLYMSEVDLPTRLDRYDGDHIRLIRIALTVEQLRGLPSFPATDKKKDPRYNWFVANHGKRC